MICLLNSNMAKVSTYLNFNRKTEEAFNFYKSVFGGEFVDGIHRMSEVPPQDGQPPLSEEDKNLVMHVELPIMNGTHSLMGTDAPESMGFDLKTGNNMYVCIQTDTRDQLEELFNKLSNDGKVEMEPQDMFFGSYFASFTDKYGVNWMLEYTTSS